MTFAWVPVGGVVETPCLVQSDLNLPLAGLINVDGVDVRPGDRVLARSQTDPIENGIYVVQSGAWASSVDFVSRLGLRIYVIDGIFPGEYVVADAATRRIIGIERTIYDGILPERVDVPTGAALVTSDEIGALQFRLLNKADVGLNKVDNTTDLEKAAVILAQKGQANGLAALGSNGMIIESQLPAIAITDVFEVATQAAMLALVTERGDVVVRTDENKSYIRGAGTSGTMLDYTLLRTPTDVVISVAGKTGAVTLSKADVGLDLADNTPDASKPVSTSQQAALNARMPVAGGTFTGKIIAAGGATTVSTGYSNNLELYGGGDGDSNVIALGFHIPGRFARAIHMRGDGYIGMTSWNWYVSPTGAMASTSYTSLSDPDLKENVKLIEGALSKVLKIDGVNFTWIEKARLTGKPGEYDVGVLANQIEEVLPEAVGLSIPDEDNGGHQWKVVEYPKLIPLLIEAIKELNRKVELLGKSQT